MKALQHEYVEAPVLSLAAHKFAQRHTAVHKSAANRSAFLALIGVSLRHKLRPRRDEMATSLDT